MLFAFILNFILARRITIHCLVLVFVLNCTYVAADSCCAVV